MPKLSTFGRPGLHRRKATPLEMNRFLISEAVTAGSSPLKEDRLMAENFYLKRTVAVAGPHPNIQCPLLGSDRLCLSP